MSTYWHFMTHSLQEAINIFSKCSTFVFSYILHMLILLSVLTLSHFIHHPEHLRCFPKMFNLFQFHFCILFPTASLSNTFSCQSSCSSSFSPFIFLSLCFFLSFSHKHSKLLFTEGTGRAFFRVTVFTVNHKATLILFFVAHR